MIEDEELDIEEVMDRLEKFENKIKFTAFGKTSKKASVPKKGGPKLVHIDESEKAKELIIYKPNCTCGERPRDQKTGCRPRRNQESVFEVLHESAGEEPAKRGTGKNV